MPGDRGKRPEIPEHTEHTEHTDQETHFNYQQAMHQEAARSSRAGSEATRDETPAQEAFARLPEQVLQKKLQEAQQLRQELQSIYYDAATSLVGANTYEDRNQAVREQYSTHVREIQTLEQQLPAKRYRWENMTRPGTYLLHVENHTQICIPRDIYLGNRYKSDYRGAVYEMRRFDNTLDNLQTIQNEIATSDVGDQIGEWAIIRKI